MYGEWDNKNASYKVNYDYVRDSLNEIDESILKCENALAGVGIGYTSQKGQIQNWYDRLDKRLRYIEGLAPHIDNVIDSPLKEDFKHLLLKYQQEQKLNTQLELQRNKLEQ